MEEERDQEVIFPSSSREPASRDEGFRVFPPSSTPAPHRGARERKESGEGGEQRDLGREGGEEEERKGGEGEGEAAIDPSPHDDAPNPQVGVSTNPFDNDDASEDAAATSPLRIENEVASPGWLSGASEGDAGARTAEPPPPSPSPALASGAAPAGSGPEWEITPAPVVPAPSEAASVPGGFYHDWGAAMKEGIEEEGSREEAECLQRGWEDAEEGGSLSRAADEFEEIEIVPLARVDEVQWQRGDQSNAAWYRAEARATSSGGWSSSGNLPEGAGGLDVLLVKISDLVAVLEASRGEAGSGAQLGVEAMSAVERTGVLQVQRVLREELVEESESDMASVDDVRSPRVSSSRSLCPTSASLAALIPIPSPYASPLLLSLALLPTRPPPSSATLPLPTAALLRAPLTAALPRAPLTAALLSAPAHPTPTCRCGRFSQALRCSCLPTSSKTC